MSILGKGLRSGMDCGLDVSEFKLKSHYYVQFPTYTLGKGINSLPV